MTSCVGAFALVIMAFALVIMQVLGWTRTNNPIELIVTLLHFWINLILIRPKATWPSGISNSLSILTLFIDELPNPKERETGYTFSKLTNSNCVKDWKLFIIYLVGILWRKENSFQIPVWKCILKEEYSFLILKNFVIYFKEKKKKKNLEADNF